MPGRVAGGRTLSLILTQTLRPNQSDPRAGIQPLLGVLIPSRSRLFYKQKGGKLFPDALT